VGIDQFEFVLDMERTFGMEIPDEIAQRIRTVGELAEYVAGRSPGAWTREKAFEAVRRLVCEHFGFEPAQVRMDSRFAQDLRLS
jgi:acyl carrier protein